MQDKVTDMGTVVCYASCQCATTVACYPFGLLDLFRPSITFLLDQHSCKLFFLLWAFGIILRNLFYFRSLYYVSLSLKIELSVNFSKQNSL